MVKNSNSKKNEQGFSATFSSLTQHAYAHIAKCSSQIDIHDGFTRINVRMPNSFLN